MIKLVILDTNVLLCLINFYESFFHLAELLSLEFQHVQMCIPDICIKELSDKLKDEGYSEKQIDDELSKLKNMLNYREIKKEPIDEEEGNYLFNKYREIKTNDGKLKLHKPDQYILAIAKRITPWRFYTTDNNFLEVVKLENIDGRKFPTQDKILELKFKTLYQKNGKRKK